MSLDWGFGKGGMVVKKNFKRLIIITLNFILLISITNYFNYIFEKYTTKEVVSNVNNVINIEKTTAILSIEKIKKLQDYYNNSDIKGIISIDGMDTFNYPVVQAQDNDYYLNHNYYKKYDAYGSIYADYRSNLDSSNKILIYGHSSSKRDVPFNKLESYYDESFYKNHKYIILETESNIYRYEIFSVYVETSDFTYMNINFDSKEDWYSHIIKIKNKSLYSTDAELTKDDDILILQTCSTNPNYKKYSKKYLLIVSRRVK